METLLTTAYTTLGQKSKLFEIQWLLEQNNYSKEKSMSKNVTFLQIGILKSL